MTLKEKLIAARALIADPKNHITGNYAYDVDNKDVSPADPRACKFCGLGAAYRIERAVTDDCTPLAAALTDAAIELFDNSVPHVNDTIGHAAVLKVYDLAIERAS